MNLIVATVARCLCCDGCCSLQCNLNGDGVPRQGQRSLRDPTKAIYRMPTLLLLGPRSMKQEQMLSLRTYQAISLPRKTYTPEYTVSQMTTCVFCATVLPPPACKRKCLHIAAAPFRAPLPTGPNAIEMMMQQQGLRNGMVDPRSGPMAANSTVLGRVFRIGGF